MSNMHEILISVFGQPEAGQPRTFVTLSQNENGRLLRFKVIGGVTIPEGATAALVGTKPDGKVYSTTGTIEGNNVIIQEDIQMTAVAGTWDAKLDIVSGTNNIMSSIIRFLIVRNTITAGSIPSDSQLDGIVAECKSYAEAAKNEAYGSPLTASTAAGMTDQQRVYVYTGTETGYTSGHWYYYDGTAWADGGVYNAAAVDTDTTLSVSGKAADAKKTGDEISELKSGLIDTRLTVYTFVDDYFVDTNDYQPKINSGYSYTTINVAPYKNLHIRTHAYKTAGICFYDSDGNGIGYIYPTDTADNYLFDALVTLPVGTATVKISTLKAQKSDFSVWTTPLELYDGLSKAIDNTKDDLDDKVDKNGEKQVTSKNVDFMFYSPNLFDVSARTDGYIVNQATGELNANTANSVSDWIPIEPLTNYVFSKNSDGLLRYCFYDKNKTFISGVLSAGTAIIPLTTPANAEYFRFSGAFATLNQVNLQFEQGSVPTKYSPYGKAYLLPQFAPQDNAVINLPSKIYALVGYELNIYFENLVEDWKKYDWDISCTRGQQLERGFRITPTSSDVGTFDLLIIAKDGYMTISKKVSLIITASTAGSGKNKSVIILGDSTTANGTAVTKLNENFSDDAMSVETLGTRGTAPNKHEGRAGWTFNDYFTTASQAGTDVVNPFFNPTTETFDASYYFANSGVSVPDWFFINLGINDTFGYSSDSALEEAILTIKELCDDMIESIKTAAPDTKIGLCLTIPPNHSQDAFGKAYNNGQNRNRYKRNNVLWVHDLIETYDGRENESIYLVPIYTNLDTVYNMGMETLPVNARNTVITYESPIGNGGVHPAESGYWQIADVYTAFLKANV